MRKIKRCISGGYHLILVEGEDELVTGWAATREEATSWLYFNVV